MSMRLACHETELIPHTPTYITYLCLYGKMGRRKYRKSPWRTILHKYLLWVQHEYPDALSDVKASVDLALKHHRRLTFDAV